MDETRTQTIDQRMAKAVSSYKESTKCISRVASDSFGFGRRLEDAQYTLENYLTKLDIEETFPLGQLVYARSEADEEGNIYSVDMLRIDASISVDRLASLVEYLCSITGRIAVVDYFETPKSQCYRHMFVLRFVNGGTIRMGFHLNDVKHENRDSGYIEYNPNSLRGDKNANECVRRIMSFFPYASLVRYDLAIDIPCYRNEVMMMKDSRIYESYRKSTLNITETLGRRSHVGRVKLYNKQLESHLSYPLTRLEITAAEDKLDIPRVFRFDKLPKAIEEDVLVRSIIMSGSPTLLLADLSPIKRNRILDILDTAEMHFDEGCISKIAESAVTLATGYRAAVMNKKE